MLENNNESTDKKEAAVNEVKPVETTIAENTENTEAINEVEESVAKDAEKDDEKTAEIPKIDYATFTLEQLVDALEKVLKNNAVQSVKNEVEAIKSDFNKKFGALLAEKKAAFLEEGGNSIDFQFSSPVKQKYNSLLSDYKKQRDAYYKNLEKQLKENLEKRLTIIEQLKQLITEANTNTMYKSFKELQETWKTIGPVPRTTYNDTWKIYHHHVERFYDLLHMSNDFRDLDFKHNLEEKLKIISIAEKLSEETDVNKAFKELQNLHKTWKEDLGPVPKENREEIWERFSAATKKIHDKRHDYFREMRSKYDEIIEKKLAIVAQINDYDTSKNIAHNDWQKSIKDIEDLRQQYFNAGKLPYAKSEEVWQKFKAATKKFNSEKNKFYKQEKSGQQENLEKKMALIEIAESLKDSEDWQMATDAMKKIQSDWKKIGHVPRKFSDDIWKRFKAACNHYFDRYHDQKNAVSKEQQAIIDAKKTFLEELKTAKDVTKESVLTAINDWNALGRLPRNMRHLEGKFNKEIDKLLSTLSIDKKEVAMLKFTNIVDSYLADNDTRKLDAEQLFVRKKIDEVVREIQQLENNLGFFSNAKVDNPLVKNVRTQIEEFKDELDVWKTKLNYIKKLDY
jgi:hypothetical protein